MSPNINSKDEDISETSDLLELHVQYTYNNCMIYYISVFFFFFNYVLEIHSTIFVGSVRFQCKCGFVILITEDWTEDLVVLLKNIVIRFIHRLKYREKDQ